MEGELLICDLSSRIDEEGFLIEGEEWNREIAEFLAMKETPNGLSEDQWKIINYLRDYYSNYRTVPAPRMLCHATGFTFKRLGDLFPSGLVKGAYRVAGIPRIVADPTALFTT